MNQSEVSHIILAPLLFFAALLAPNTIMAKMVDKTYLCEMKKTKKEVMLQYSTDINTLPCEVIIVKDNHDEQAFYFDKVVSTCQIKYIDTLLDLTRKGFKCKLKEPKVDKPVETKE